MADSPEEPAFLITADHLLLFDSSELAACVEAATGATLGAAGDATIAGTVTALRGVTGLVAARAWHPIARTALVRMEASPPVPGLADMVANLRASAVAVAARLEEADLAEQSERVQEIARAPVPAAGAGAPADLRVVHTLPTLADVDPGGEMWTTDAELALLGAKRLGDVAEALRVSRPAGKGRGGAALDALHGTALTEYLRPFRSADRWELAQQWALHMSEIFAEKGGVIYKRRGGTVDISPADGDALAARIRAISYAARALVGQATPLSLAQHALLRPSSEELGSLPLSTLRRRLLGRPGG